MVDLHRPAEVLDNLVLCLSSVLCREGSEYEAMTRQLDGYLENDLPTDSSRVNMFEQVNSLIPWWYRPRR